VDAEEGVDESWQEQPNVPLWNSQPQWVSTSESVLLRVFAFLLMCGKVDASRDKV
jgi:hypothetical protein